MIDIGKDRRKFRAANAKLRRCRHLYIFFLRHTIQTWQDVCMAAEVMIAEGMYAEATNESDVRYSIIRKLYRLVGNEPRHWTGLEHWQNWMDKFEQGPKHNWGGR